MAAGEKKGRKLTIPFTSTELPTGVPVGGRTDVTLFTNVTGDPQEAWVAGIRSPSPSPSTSPRPTQPA